jgi:hypothetical protein
MPPLLCGHRQRSCDSPPTGTFAGDITAVLAWPHPLFFARALSSAAGQDFPDQVILPSAVHCGLAERFSVGWASARCMPGTSAAIAGPMR